MYSILVTVAEQIKLIQNIAICDDEVNSQFTMKSRWYEDLSGGIWCDLIILVCKTGWHMELGEELGRRATGEVGLNNLCANKRITKRTRILIMCDTPKAEMGLSS